MATATVAPVVEAPVTAAAAAPDTSASSAAVETTAPATTTESSPGAVEQADQKSFEEILAAALNKGVQERSGETVSEEEKLTAEAAGTKTEEAKTPEQLAEEENLAAAKTDETNDLDVDTSDVNTKWLADKITDKTLDIKDEAVKGQLFKMAREYSELKPMQELFPDVESAKYAAENAATYRGLYESFDGATSVEGTQKFLNELAELSKTAEGTSPAFSSFVENINELNMQYMEKQFKASGDEAALAALDILKERISPDRSQASEEVSPQLAARESALKQRETELARTQQEQKAAAQTQFNETVGDDLQGKIDGLIGPALTKAAFTPAIAEAVRTKIEQKIMQVLDNHALYKAQSKELYKKGVTDEVKGQRVALAMKYVNTIAPDIIRKEVREFSAPVMKAQEERQAKQTAQADRSKSEPKGASIATGTPQNLNPQQNMEKIVAELTAANGGRRPDTDQIIAKFMELKAAGRRQ